MIDVGRFPGCKQVFSNKDKVPGSRTLVRPKLGISEWSQICHCKKGTDWLKRWVEAQHNIYVKKCFVIGQ